MAESDNRRAGGGGGSDRLLDERILRGIERDHPEGLAATDIIEAFRSGGVKLTEASFRKWVQVGLLPRSRRVGGRKGKHSGSHGLYPTSVLRRINHVKRLMAENLTVEDIRTSLQFRDDIEALGQGISSLLGRFAALMDDLGARLRPADRTELKRVLADAEGLAGELTGRIESLEKRIVSPLVQAARQRAFASGAAGGADELL